MSKIWRKIGTFMVAGILLCQSALRVSADEADAEEVTPAGYHVYDVQEDQSIDHWYGIARGDILQSGLSKLLKDGTGYVICSGNTMAHRDCDRVYVRIYLDQSDTGTDGWGTIDYWTGIDYDNSFVTVCSDSYPITRDKYYSVKGAHSAMDGEIAEATTTCTNALYFD